MFVRFLSVLFVMMSVFSIRAYSADQTECNSMGTCLDKILEIRHSGYDFDVAKPVDPELFVPLANAARLSPSSYNEQPWRFIFCDSVLTPEAYLKALNSLKGGNGNWAAKAPLFVIVASKTVFTKNNKPNLWDKYDTGSAVMSFTLKAASMGLMTHQIGGFDVEAITKEFEIPADYQPVVIIAVGYESSNENKPKVEHKRLQVAETFYLGGWNTPLE